MLHDVGPQVYEGMLRSQDDFFLRMPGEDWCEKARQQNVSERQSDENELLSPTRLTNPLLNRKLQSMLDNEQATVETRRLIMYMVGFGRHLLNVGISLRLLVDIGTLMREQGNRIDFDMLKQWAKQLSLKAVMQLAGLLLVRLFEFKKEEIPFVDEEKDTLNIERLLDDTFSLRSRDADDWYFTQGKNIFVQTNNSQAMFGQLRYSIKHFGIFPAETFTNFFASFAHSLSHIEE